MVRWVLPLGVAYIVVFEGVFANIDFMVRQADRPLVRPRPGRALVRPARRGLGDRPDGPDGTEAAVASAFLFGARELRVKTPEGG